MFKENKEEKIQTPSSYDPPTPTPRNDCFNEISRKCEGRPSKYSNAVELYEGLP